MLIEERTCTKGQGKEVTPECKMSTKFQYGMIGPKGKKESSIGLCLILLVVTIRMPFVFNPNEKFIGKLRLKGTF